MTGKWLFYIINNENKLIVIIIYFNTVEPTPTLHEKSIESTKYPKDTNQIVQDLLDTLYETNSGVGIAAPQIGENVRIFICDITYVGLNIKAPHIFIDPIIISTSQNDDLQKEGCLSCPGIDAVVPRPIEVTIEYTDQNGDRKIQTYNSFLARVIQHEFEHLEGITLKQRLKQRSAFLPSK